MKKGQLMKGYLMEHAVGGLIFLVFCGIFGVIVFLYNLPTEAWMYGVLLCACTGAVILVLDFLRYRKKYTKLVIAEKTVKISLEGVPEGRRLIEGQYKKLLGILSDEKQRIEAENWDREKEALDYYTLWVHQIKTPISAMGLILQRSEKTAEHEEMAAELFKIEEYAGMVLSYLRLNGDTGDLVLKEYALDKIVTDAVKKYARVFIRRKIKIDYQKTELTVLTDEKWMTFVIEQLLSNALKYTGEGTITVRAVEEALIIEDTGIGIAPEDLPRVCDRGYTGYNGRYDKKSTGLGLYLCRNILKKLGHKMVISSEPGKGTAVKIDFQAAELQVE